MEYANSDFAISFRRNWFPDGFPEMKTILITDSEITSTDASLKSKNSSGSFIHLFHIPLILYRCGTSHLYI